MNTRVYLLNIRGRNIDAKTVVFKSWSGAARGGELLLREYHADSNELCVNVEDWVTEFLTNDEVSVDYERYSLSITEQEVQS